MSVKLTFLALKKGRGKGGNLDKIQKNRIFFRETFPNQVVYQGTFTTDDQYDDDDEP